MRIAIAFVLFLVSAKFQIQTVKAGECVGVWTPPPGNLFMTTEDENNSTDRKLTILKKNPSIEQSLAEGSSEYASKNEEGDFVFLPKKTGSFQVKIESIEPTTSCHFFIEFIISVTKAVIVEGGIKDGFDTQTCPSGLTFREELFEGDLACFFDSNTCDNSEINKEAFSCKADSRNHQKCSFKLFCTVNPDPLKGKTKKPDPINPDKKTSDTKNNSSGTFDDSNDGKNDSTKNSGGNLGGDGSGEGKASTPASGANSGGISKDKKGDGQKSSLYDTNSLQSNGNGNIKGSDTDVKKGSFNQKLSTLDPTADANDPKKKKIKELLKKLEKNR